MQATLPNPVAGKNYWVDDFTVRDEDLEHIFNQFLEIETPLSLRDITLELIEFRIKQEETHFKKQYKNGAVYQPKNRYEVGQDVIFPALDYKVGKVLSVRPGNNLEYGDFEVITVQFGDGSTQEFGTNASIEHVLNADVEVNFEEEIDAQFVLKNYGRVIARKIKTRFDQDEDVVYLGGRWFLHSLLADINIAHLHLAEAILDMNGGGPMTTEAISREIGMQGNVNENLHLFSLDYAMQRDERFDEVGPAGQVLWYLARMEPEAVRKTPSQLEYETINYNPDVFDEEMQRAILEIDDELSEIDAPENDVDEVTLRLTYPYRRTGTLPLSARLRDMFPTAYETTRIRMTLVDAETKEEVPGWVVRELGYVYGLFEYYTKYMLPVGGYVTLRRDPADASRLIVDFKRRPRARAEVIKLAVPENGRLRFQNHKRQVGADYDELMNFGVEDLAGLDALWSRYATLPLHEILRRVMPELQTLSLQNAVHLTTIYSAVNMLRRCPPEPLFATLATHPDFENVGGPYWRLIANS